VEAGIKVLGTSVDAIDLAEDRGRFGGLLESLGYQAPPYAEAHSVEQALSVCDEVGFPLLVRPSYVLGGRAMEIVYSQGDLEDYLSRNVREDGRAIYLDRFLENAIEVDVDALCDGTSVWIGGIMQHVEEAGIHSGDSACVLPPHSLGPEMMEAIRQQSEGIAKGLGVVGLCNIQFAVYGAELFVIEANPRASRTVPFVSKAIGLPLAKLACRLMLGETIEDLELPRDPMGHDHVSVKEAVMPFDRFDGADALLGPEMRSTGEVMGVARDFPTAFAKAQAAAGAALPDGGTAFITVTDSDKAGAVAIAQTLHDLGFKIVATRGTREALERMGVPATELMKVGEGSPNVVDMIESGDVTLVVNTPTGSGARSDGWEIRRAAVARSVPCLTTLAGGLAAVRAIASARSGEAEVLSLQEIHRGLYSVEAEA
jgi:carbamoyl-phosphate synthase large subunit